MNYLQSLTSAQLNHAADLKEKIEELESELAAILGGSSSAPAKRGPGRPRKIPAFDFTTPMLVFKHRKMSSAARALLAASAKKRWAKAKAEGKTSL
jgi:hypothetical protein